MAKKYLQPAGDHVLVTDIERTQTIDGITLPDNIRQQEMVYGYVIAVGPLAAGRVKEAETVCYGPYAGKNVVLEGVEFRIIKEGQIEAWVREAAADIQVSGGERVYQMVSGSEGL